MTEEKHPEDPSTPEDSFGMKSGRHSFLRRYVGLIAWAALLVVSLIAFSPHGQERLVRTRLVNYETVRRIGFGAYAILDIYDTALRHLRRSRIKEVDPAPFRNYLKMIAATRRSPPPAVQRPRKSVVYLQLEAIEGQLLGRRKNGKPVMPFLESLAARNVSFTSVQDNTSSGRTTDAEFLVLTSEVPLPHRPVFVANHLDRIPSMPRVLDAAGYLSVSMHGHKMAFWHRSEAHPALGFDEMFFADKLHLTERIGWGWSDKQVFLAAADMIIESDRPLFLHVISLSSHHPYDYVAKAEGRTPGKIEAEYLRSARYVDNCLREFFDRLEKAGALDRCLIAIYGDHDSAITSKVSNFLDPSEPARLTDRVPLVLVGFDRPPRRVDALSGLQDLPVMVLEELGLAVPLTFTGNGWDHWGRTIGAEQGGREDGPDGSIAAWQEPVDQEILTRLAVNRPDDLIEP